MTTVATTSGAGMESSASPAWRILEVCVRGVWGEGYGGKLGCVRCRRV